jgi:hypothetical protein
MSLYLKLRKINEAHPLKRDNQNSAMRKALQNKFQYDLFVIGAGSAGVRLGRVSGGHGADRSPAQCSVR